MANVGVSDSTSPARRTSPLPLLCPTCFGDCRPTVAGWCRCGLCGLELSIVETAEYRHAH